ncbi:hypothetical protein SLEP1_g47133 [Rubroshorea leprosula]|uniref:Uncharacterized protein n=1 Tax=Rubroshorea leprosula TaxID=152421 RepID=A0AAV5LS24_9ROSI|nr:hypothetical protein SLEP1_g47133 [Rubroshorea leprosula]
MEINGIVLETQWRQTWFAQYVFCLAMVMKRFEPTFQHRSHLS